MIRRKYQYVNLSEADKCIIKSRLAAGDTLDMIRSDYGYKSRQAAHYACKRYGLLPSERSHSRHVTLSIPDVLIDKCVLASAAFETTEADIVRRALGLFFRHHGI